MSTRPFPLSSAQYATPRLLLRGVRLPRSPSSRLYAHSVSPVAASIATAARCIPAEKKSFPLTASGVTSQLKSGRAPKFSDFQRQATLSFATLDASIWLSGEYLVPPGSPPIDNQSAPVDPVCAHVVRASIGRKTAAGMLDKNCFDMSGPGNSHLC